MAIFHPFIINKLKHDTLSIYSLISLTFLGYPEIKIALNDFSDVLSQACRAPIMSCVALDVGILIISIESEIKK